MITPGYMLKKPPGPSAAKLFLDQQVFPAAIDIAGSVEVALQRASKRTGVSVPALLAGTACVLGMLAWQISRAGGRRR